MNRAPLPSGRTARRGRVHASRRTGPRRVTAAVPAMGAAPAVPQVRGVLRVARAVLVVKVVLAPVAPAVRAAEGQLGPSRTPAAIPPRSVAKLEFSARLN